jgi:creatinine amidohydrolase
MAFPGTISLQPETFEAIYSDYCRSLAAHGFRTILCFSAHGGNFAPLAEMEQRLNSLVGPSTRVIVFADLHGLIDTWRSAVAEAGGPADHVGGHACVGESSVYSYLQPGQVRTDQLARGYMGPLDDAFLEGMFTGGLKAITDTGVMGDPHGLSGDIGELCVQRVADLIAAHFQERMAVDEGRS